MFVKRRKSGTKLTKPIPLTMTANQKLSETRLEETEHLRLRGCVRILIPDVLIRVLLLISVRN